MKRELESTPRLVYKACYTTNCDVHFVDRTLTKALKSAKKGVDFKVISSEMVGT